MPTDTDTLTPRTALLQVRALLAEPERWCKCSPACDAIGGGVNPVDPTACRWCLDGAIQFVVGDDPELLAKVRTIIHPVARRLYPYRRGFSHMGVNDDPATTHADILAVLDAAIEEASHG